ncbi:hypothetical protein [Amycolatopsis taiwanensis]|uniref:DUF1795 domain-containing protein n=1 Tax=Amycolatopsis taiwanensis TaxID=342230 RepID=A0A9W6QZW1_9PSEU|nr:hypothetical protein [Amycolatopsis taiwanensis]GLY67031.1 hypothetical protein Atai01_36500 [Amycolatopsis taiwanensis]
MVATIPVPIQFSLPEGWRSVPPDQAGAPGAAFVALHPPASQGFTANITISGELHADDVPLTQIADDAVDRLRAGAREVQLGRRSEVGSPASPGLTQAVRLSVLINGAPAEIVQFQVFLAMRDTRDPRRRAVLHVVLSSLPEQFAGVIDDFQKFIETIRPEVQQ